MNTLIHKLLSIFNKNKYYPIEVQSPVFDLSQSYGGNQASPCSEKDPDKITRYYDIIRKNNPALIMNDEQLKHYLNRLYSEGCGYVSICNSVLRYHIGQEDSYQSHFGYPLYTTQNNIDFDTLIVDFYSATDNRPCLPDPMDINFYEDYNEKTDGPKEEYDFQTYPK